MFDIVNFHYYKPSANNNTDFNILNFGCISSASLY